MKKNSKVLVAGLIGAVVGAGAALLLAPNSGKETRKKIADKYDDAKDSVKNIKENLVEKGSEILSKVNAS